MAFNIHAINYYGQGAGNLIVPAANTIINHYAQITAVEGKVLTVGNISANAQFVVGNLIFMHVTWHDDYSGNVGRWRVSRIMNISGDQITLYSDCSGILGGESDCHVQIVTLPEYASVTLNAGTSITCPAYDSTLGYGGIVAFKCSEVLTFNGGHINLVGKGLPSAAMRTYFQHETRAYQVANENYDTMTRLAMNHPDGCAFIVANKFVGHSDSRIGNINQSGTARTPIYNEYGGSSILLVAKTIENFQPAMISKLPSADGGKGKGRCYIATESQIPCDEGLYAYDRISDSARVGDLLKVKNFGDASDGTRTNYTSQLNNYARVTAVDSTRKVFTVDLKTSTGLAKFKVGALVMIHVGAKDYYALQGRFNLARILDITLNKITVDTALFDGNNFKSDKYYIQMITVPQFENFTLNKEHTSTPKWENGIGGICALAVSDTCDLSSGILNVVGKGGPSAGGKTMLDKYISNAQMAQRLPIGQGNGSVFILANNLIMNEDTRIGGTWSGNAFGGSYTTTNSNVGWKDTRNVVNDGSGAGGGVAFNANLNTTTTARAGGYNSNGLYSDSEGVSEISGYQGAHILIIANQITGLCLHALSTGGQGAQKTSSGGLSSYKWIAGASGGCGYGGGSGMRTSTHETVQGGSGGYIGGGAGFVREMDNNFEVYGGGGGSSGFAFVYCNKGVSQKITYLLK